MNFCYLFFIFCFTTTSNLEVLAAPHDASLESNTLLHLVDEVKPIERQEEDAENSNSPEDAIRREIGVVIFGDVTKAILGILRGEDGGKGGSGKGKEEELSIRDRVIGAYKNFFGITEATTKRSKIKVPANTTTTEPVQTETTIFTSTSRRPIKKEAEPEDDELYGRHLH